MPGDISHGLGIIGTIAKEVADVKIIDNNSNNKTHSIDQLVTSIGAFKPDIIGFHVHANNIFRTKNLIEKIKSKFPEICLLGGGLHTYAQPQEVADIGMNIVAIEEADLTIMPLLSALETCTILNGTFCISNDLSDKLAKIPGLLFFNNDSGKWISSGKPEYIKDLDALPFIDHELFNLEDYIHSENDHHWITNTLITMRGCPFDCSFCQFDDFGAYKMVRYNSTEYRINYMKYLVEKYNHKYLIFYDANFTLNKAKTLEFCNAMRESGLNRKVKFWCESNVILPLDQELVQNLQSAGCAEIALGVERLTRKGLGLIGKNKDYNLIIDTIAKLKEAGIRVTANALVGFPFDSVELVEKEEKRFIELLNHVHSCTVNILMPIPGTSIHEQTELKQWYLNEELMNWKPPFYHFAYNFYNAGGVAWAANFFNLEPQTMNAVRKMREKIYGLNMKKLHNPLVDILFGIVKMTASISYRLYKASPKAERLFFAPVIHFYLLLWKTMVSKLYTKTSD